MVRDLSKLATEYEANSGQALIITAHVNPILRPMWTHLRWESNTAASFRPHRSQH